MEGDDKPNTIEQTVLEVLGIRFGIGGETCVVSYPEADGTCGREAVMTRYGGRSSAPIGEHASFATILFGIWQKLLLNLSYS